QAAAPPPPPTFAPPYFPPPGFAPPGFVPPPFPRPRERKHKYLLAIGIVGGLLLIGLYVVSEIMDLRDQQDLAQSTMPQPQTGPPPRNVPYDPITPQNRPQPQQRSLLPPGNSSPNFNPNRQPLRVIES